MDLSTFVTRIANRLNIDSSDPLYASLDEYVNEGLHYLESTAAEGYPWMRDRYSVTTTAGTNSYAFTTISTSQTLTKILDVEILNQNSVWQPMDLVNAETSTLRYGSITEDIPEAWFAEGQTLYIYPIPDDAYTLRVRAVKMEPDLGGNGSTPVLPVVFHQAVIHAALVSAYSQLQDFNRVAAEQNMVDQWVERMRKHGAEYASAPKITVRDPLFL